MNAKDQQKAARHILDRSKDIYRVARRRIKDGRDTGMAALKEKQPSQEERLRMITSGEAVLNPALLRDKDNGRIAIVTEAFDCPGDAESRQAEDALEAEYLARMEKLEKAYFEIRDRANLLTGEVEHEATVQMFEKFKADYYVPVAERNTGSFGLANYQE